ncbi:DUF5686 and carboxypeptidase regulatory-like domain-containing protein [Arcticibacter eurypsychrophilus]|uniref:DUF5686 and carboxypeptidase regulatory-like domain-containing protein n=1 Tax=Arcticibacter eurypsychrophilus TaxID=1434752 RepID=UPI00084DFC48|nr:DUF5686 and carboxypeptidase regulatory-like domain-containing protein [Arcticibacter eurypsychrophilus]
MNFLYPKFLTAAAALLCFFSSVYGQGIKGVIRATNGEPLPYASIFLVGSKSGTSANSIGEYEIKLPSGTYAIRIQNIGYVSQEKEVVIGSDWAIQDFSLKVQGYQLQEVRIGKGEKGDYANTIIRNAIAKSKFHRLQYTDYQMKVYVKGTGELLKAPFFVKGKLKKEGVKLNEAYTSESVSMINFSQPDKVTEKVIATRSTGEDSGVGSPSMFIAATFYKDKVANIISPLSRSAFNYYRFKYEGSFTEGNHIINKILVIPRSKGDNVFEGSIFIIEDEWAIHSVNLRTSVLGFPILVRQNFAEVAPLVWLPVNHQYDFSGNVLGFAGHYKYIAVCSQFKVTLNKDLIAKAELMEDSKPLSSSVVELPVSNNAKLSRKQFRKMVDQVEKESLKQQRNPEIIKERAITTDSLARKRDSVYWTNERSVPLTTKEVQGYHRDDSLVKVDSIKKSLKDSTGVKKHKLFNPLDLVTGGYYKVFTNTSIKIDPSFTQFYFNTIEGFNVNLSGELKYDFDSLKRSLSFAPALRYGFSSHTLYSKATLNYRKENAGIVTDVSLSRGQFVSQFNDEEPIHPLVNSISSLFARRNYMKLYEKTFLKAGYTYKPSAFFSMSLNAEWAKRSALYNQSDYSFFKSDSRDYTLNIPVNITDQNTDFATHNAFIADIQLKYRPIQSYRTYNGKKIPLYERSPELLLNYKKGISGVLGSDVDFDQLELGVNHGFEAGLGSRLNFEVRGGTFLNSKQMYFMDYKHFDANRVFLASAKPAGTFRLLDYYYYSTNGSYVTANVYYQIRKLLFTRIPEVRLAGLKENLFGNYLKTERSANYYELGYSLDNIFRIFRVEIATSFLDSHYKEFGYRIGIATMFKITTK